MQRGFRWVGLFVALWIAAHPPKVLAMMQETSTGKVVEVWGGKFGYQSRTVFWSELGDFRSQHVHLGPIELIHTDPKTTPAQYASPERLGLRVGTWSTVLTLDSSRRTGIWVGLILALAIAAGIWRKRITDRQKNEAPAVHANK